MELTRNEAADGAIVSGMLLPYGAEDLPFVVSQSPAKFIEVLMDDGVRHHLYADGCEPPDLEQIWQQLQGLECEDGGWLVNRHDTGVYEVCPVFPPDAQYRDHKCRAMLRWMITSLDADRIVARLPEDAPEEIEALEALGFMAWLSRPDSWSRGEHSVATVFLTLEADAWIARDTWFRTIGATLRSLVDGSPCSAPELDAYLGAAATSVRTGNPVRAAAILNRTQGLVELARTSVVNGWLRTPLVELKIKGGQLAMRATAP